MIEMFQIYFIACRLFLMENATCVLAISATTLRLYHQSAKC